MSGDELRARFLLQSLFQPGRITLDVTDLDRMIIGTAVPTSKPMSLPPLPQALGTQFFLQRRELGIINLGADGIVTLGQSSYRLERFDCLYVGAGEEHVTFASQGDASAQFYFVSAPAHTTHPHSLVRFSPAETPFIGESEKANRRRIHRLIHPDGVQSCQLTMGFTEFEPGSVWNTMPPHTHSRRSEVYLYFDLIDARVFHFLGKPDETRHLVVADRQAVLSPPWSIHCGVGTGNYRFVWAMAGENQTFTDMDPVLLRDLK